MLEFKLLILYWSLCLLLGTISAILFLSDCVFDSLQYAKVFFIPESGMQNGLDKYYNDNNIL